MSGMSGPRGDQSANQRDLVVLVADKYMEAALHGILARPEALKIRAITWEFFAHPEHDPGCFLRGQDLLLAQQNRFAHALVMFDRQGCGQERRLRPELESDVEKRLHDSGWGDRAAAVCLDPELECWVWSDSPEVGVALGWEGRQSALRPWLAEHMESGQHQTFGSQKSGFSDAS